MSSYHLSNYDTLDLFYIYNMNGNDYTIIFSMQRVDTGKTSTITSINSSPPGQNGRHFYRRHFETFFLNENVRISIQFSLKFVPKGPIDNISALV